MANHFVSIDLEDWYADVEEVPGSFNEAFFRQYSSIIDCLQRTGTSCTFFVLGKTAERYPELVLRLKNMGHEIASHGYGHDRVDSLTPKQFAEDIDRSIEIIREITKTNPIGYRAPFFSVSRKEFWFYEILAERGFEYSSSVFPYYGRKYGIGDFSLSPQKIITSSGREIAEYPLAVLEAFGRRVPIAGGGFWRLLPSLFIQGGIKRLEKEGRSFVMYLHPHEFDFKSLKSHRGILRNIYINLGRPSIQKKFTRALTEFHFEPFQTGMPKECLE